MKVPFILSFFLNKKLKFKKNYKHEINKILSRLVYFEKPTIKKLIPYEFNKDLYKRIKNNDNFVKLNEITKSKTDKFILYQILYPGEFQKIYFGDKYTELNNPIIRIDIDDLIYIFKHKQSMKKIIYYLADK